VRNDTPVRLLEGLPLEKEVVRGTLSILPVIHEREVVFEVDPFYGQKTGFFLDQKENREAFASYIQGGRGLDLFCYSGVWGLHLAKKGAYVTGVDDSEEAIRWAKKNALLNGLEDKCNFLKGDVFTFLKDEAEYGETYDFIVLDPPSFVKSRAKIKEAIQGYVRLNSLAMKVLKKGGILATSSCSHHVEKNLFLDILRKASSNVRKNTRLMEYRSQGRDHPVLLSVPETEYLKCAFLELE